jgi:hypothetical protein
LGLVIAGNILVFYRPASKKGESIAVLKPNT